MKPKNIRHIRDIKPKKSDKITDFLKEVNESFDEGEVTNAVCFIDYDDDTTAAITMDSNLVKTLGMIEFGKTLITRK